AEDGIRDFHVTGVQTCALPISNAVGASRGHLLKSVDRALERLRTDYIDVLQLHHFDSQTPVEATMTTLDDLVRAGKVRYVGVSNFSGWQVMKALAASDRRGYARVVAQQVYYSLIEIGRAAWRERGGRTR